MFITILPDAALVLSDNSLMYVAATTLPLIRKCVKEGNYYRMTTKEFNEKHQKATNKYGTKR